MTFDSNDEKYFSWWCQELKDAGIIIDYKRCNSFKLNNGFSNNYTKTTQLKTKIKEEIKTKVLIEEKIYTPDFMIIWKNPYDLNNKFVQELIYAGVYNKPLYHQASVSIIEIKPIFDQNNMTRLFKTNQAIMWDKYGIYVNLITYQELFEVTFTPLKYIIEEGSYKNNSKHGKKGDNKIKWKVRTLEEYLNE